VLAVLGARTAAMALNRVIDAHLDAKNTRTASRAIPSRRLTARSMLVLAVLGLCLMVYAASQLNALCLYLSPLAVCLLVGYSYTKRFTYLCHYVLGLTLGAGVVGGWLAVDGAFSGAALLHGLAICLWVAGFDILYATQDISFDRQSGLHSIPAKFGLHRAALIAQISHALCWVCLVLVFVLAGHFRWAFAAAAVLVAACLVYQHYIIRTGVLTVCDDNLSTEHRQLIDRVFFEANAYLSVLYFFCVLIGTKLRI
jgi:4-hydroxybenzoate polyprenyltransferase